MSEDRKRVAIVGAGPAGLMAAERLAELGAAVTLYDRMPGPGRKLLMAGRGGLNLTHSEPLDRFLTRYGAAEEVLAPAIENFSPQAARTWCDGLGQETFVGSSGRVFPKAMKASPLLRNWSARLNERGVRFVNRHAWEGWSDDGALRFRRDDEVVEDRPDATILALGGASWPRLGADGGWVPLLRARGVEVTALRPANCGFAIPWSQHFRERFAGTPLKSVQFSFGGTSLRGEALIASYGIEGGAIYALSAMLREALEEGRDIILLLDLRPDISPTELEHRLAAPRGSQSLSNFLRKAAGLSPIAIGLLREDFGAGLTTDPKALAARIKNLPLRLTAPAPIARAISTAGGIKLSELDEGFMLRRLPGVFAAGEMLDWEAPTGGYLLQACLATGRAAAEGAWKWLQT
jgi:uncharacterized flavoprotein (TIGR03862 family)